MANFSFGSLDVRTSALDIKATSCTGKSNRQSSALRLLDFKLSSCLDQMQLPFFSARSHQHQSVKTIALNRALDQTLLLCLMSVSQQHNLLPGLASLVVGLLFSQRTPPWTYNFNPNQSAHLPNGYNLNSTRPEELFVIPPGASKDINTDFLEAQFERIYDIALLLVICGTDGKGFSSNLDDISVYQAQC